MLHRCSAEQIQAPHPALALGKQSWSSCPLGHSAGGPPPGQVEGGCSRGATGERSPQQRAPAAHTWHLQFSPHVPPSVAPSFNFEVLHQVRELRYDTRARAVNPNLVNRRTDFGSPRQFTKTKAGLQRIAAGYRATQTVEEQSEQLCFPTLQTWRVIKPGRHWFSNTLAH